MLLPCPHCGDRDVSEFSYLGDASVTRPNPEKAKPQHWNAFVYNRENPRGPHRELWQHNGGCRLILEVTRDTLTHEILSMKATGPHKAGLST